MNNEYEYEYEYEYELIIPSIEDAIEGGYDEVSDEEIDQWMEGK